MFWGDYIADSFLKERGSKSPLIIRDEKTVSGRIHIGSMRSLALHSIVSEILIERGVDHKFFYEINDFDPMDDLPEYLDKKEYEPHMGKPLYLIPSPRNGAKNFAEYFADEYKRAIARAGFEPEYTLASELYLSGRMNEVIDIALTHASDIRKIYKEESGSIKDEDWLPLHVVCEKCQKLSTTRVMSYDGKKVTYDCGKDAVVWTSGCGHDGSVSPFDGSAKLPWKVDWAAKFRVYGVDLEAAGKDHYTRGGSRHVANRIAKEVFEIEPPFDVSHEFILVDGKKMSSSKGKGIAARDIAELLPTEQLRLLLIGKNIERQVNFDPEGDTIPLLFDQYDAGAERYFSDDKNDEARIFQMVHVPAERGDLTLVYLPRFSQIAHLVQMKHLDLAVEVSRMKGEELTDGDLKEMEVRAETALKWLALYAPESYKFELHESSVPEAAQNLSDEIKEALSQVLAFIEENKDLDGQTLHGILHKIRKETEVDPKKYFGAIYLSFLNKDSGPKAGWFLSVLNRDFLIRRLQEVTK
jgi:lysyl-tRNA synthetase, class I